MYMLAVMQSFKSDLTVQTTFNLCPSVKSVANKTFSHRLTQIILISSIYSFPDSFILHIIINYRRLGHYRIFDCAV